MEGYLLDSCRYHCSELAHLKQQDNNTLRMTIVKLLKQLNAEERALHTFNQNSSDTLDSDFEQLMRKLSLLDENYCPLQPPERKRKSFLDIQAE